MTRKELELWAFNNSKADSWFYQIKGRVGKTPVPSHKVSQNAEFVLHADQAHLDPAPWQDLIPEPTIKKGPKKTTRSEVRRAVLGVFFFIFTAFLVINTALSSQSGTDAWIATILFWFPFALVYAIIDLCFKKFG